MVTTWPALKDDILKVVAVKATAEPQYKTFVDNEFPLFALRDSLSKYRIQDKNSYFCVWFFKTWPKFLIFFSIFTARFKNGTELKT